MVESKERPTPFAIQFQEKIPEEDVAQIEGKYNEKTQKWDWPKNPENPSIVMSGINPDRPPTFCITATTITREPLHVSADKEHDD